MKFSIKDFFSKGEKSLTENFITWAVFTVDKKQNNIPNNIRIIISVAPNSGCAERT